nr:reverse transcriptase domain-containing protein [Tanacetum cinerariifolium]
MHTRASKFELVEPLPEPERTLNRRLRQRNRRFLFEQRINPPQQPRVVYAPILDINYFRHFLVTLQNFNPMDDESMWVADRVVAPNPGFAITIPETANEFAIKEDFYSNKESIHLNNRELSTRQFSTSITSVTFLLPFKTSIPWMTNPCGLPTVLSLRIPVSQSQFLKPQTNSLLKDTENEVFHLMMFPLSLTREAKTWLDELNEGTIKTIDIINGILKEDFDALLDEGSEILHSIKGTILEEILFAEFNEFMEMTTHKNSESESDTEEPPFEKITFNTDYKIKTSLKEPPTDLELKPLPDNLECIFLEEPSFLLMIISSQLSE